MIDRLQLLRAALAMSVVIGFVAAPIAVRADEIRIIEGETAGDEFGSRVVSIADVDGDLIDDIVVSAPRFDGVGGADAGKVYVLSGVDGTEIRSFEGESGGDRFGTAIAARDDVIMVGAPFRDIGGFTDAGKVYVFQASTGAAITTFDGDFSFDQFGSAVALADTNADAILDYVIGAPFYDAPAGPDSGRVLVRSGADDAVLHVLDGAAGDDFYGTSVAGAGLVDVDTNEDFIVGAPGYDGAAGAESGRAYLVSGDLASNIRFFDGLGAGDTFGSWVDGGGRLDSDTVDDVVVCAPNYTAGARSERGIARAYAGDTGALLLSRTGEDTEDHFGTAAAIVADIDGDGEQDVLVGSPDTNAPKGADSGRAYLYTASSGALLMEWAGDAAGDAFGSAVTGIGDVDADFAPDIVVGARLADGVAGADCGKIYVLSGDPFKHCNQGNANWGNDAISNVLFLQGSSGGATRRVSVAEGERTWGSIIKPPAGGNGKYVIHANAQAPDFTTLAPLPKEIGTSCFDVVLQFGATPVAVWNTIGKEDKVGEDMYFDGSPQDTPPNASTIFFKLTNGDPVNLPAGTTLTFQAILIDPATASNAGASLTNAVIVDIL